MYHVMYHVSLPLLTCDLFTSYHTDRYIETEYQEEKSSVTFPTITICFADNFVDHKFKVFPRNITLEEYKRIWGVVHMDKKVDQEDIDLIESLNLNTYEELVRWAYFSLDLAFYSLKGTNLYEISS